MKHSTPHLYVIMTDDDEDDRSVFAEIFAVAAPAAKLQLATSGANLLDLLKNNPLPDLLFIDINMPRMTGLECLQKIKANPLTKHIPVVMYTTSEAQTDIDHSFKNGATHFLTKSHDTYHIEKALKFLLEKNYENYTSTLSEFVITPPAPPKSRLF